MYVVLYNIIILLYNSITIVGNLHQAKISCYTLHFSYFLRLLCISSLNFIQNITQDRDEGKPPTKKPKIGTQSYHLEDDMYTPLSQGSIIDRGGERSSPRERVIHVQYCHSTS